MNGVPMTTTLSTVDDFAAAVRAALADLPDEEVDDLTDGLEADLTERASDEESPDFGDPLLYASELRSAAGLPPRVARRPSTLGSVFGSAWTDLIGGLHELQKHTVIARLVAFFVALRPVWWLFRAIVFYGVLTWLFALPFLQVNFGTFILGLASLIVSVQFGRGRWQPKAWMRTALVVTNVLLVLAVPVALISIGSAFGSQLDNAYAQGQNDGSHSQNGLVYNGRSVSNIFAYDASGQALTEVQLYDQTGRPLYTVPDPQDLTTDSPYLVPFAGKHGRGGWNVYPLDFVTENQLDINDGAPDKNATPSPSRLNDLLVAPLTAATPKATPRPTAVPSETATPTATPTPTPAPTN
jgi:hypothetical protein